MNSIKNFLRLDFITIRPYITLKNLIIMIVAGFFMTFGSASANGIMAFTFFFGNIYLSYTFAVGEQNGIDVLYETLPFSRANVVTSRYLFALLLSLFFSILGVILSTIFSFFLKLTVPFRETLILAVLYFLIGCLINVIQLPIYFKNGYAKAKNTSMIALFSVAAVVVLFVSLSSKTTILKGFFSIFRLVPPFVLGLLALLFLILFGFVSLSLSKKYYLKRDF